MKTIIGLAAAFLMLGACGQEAAPTAEEQPGPGGAGANEAATLNDVVPAPAPPEPAASAGPVGPKPAGPITKQIPPKDSPPPAPPKEKAEPDPHAGHDMNKM